MRRGFVLTLYRTDTSTYKSWWVLAYLVLLKALFSWTNYNNKERVL